MEQAVIKSLMEADGGDFSKLNLVPSTVSDVITALNTNIDTVWIFYAWDGVATELKGYDTNFMDFAKLNTTFDYYTPIIIANNDFLAENPDTAKAFLAATAKGYEYAIENPDAAADILLEAAPELLILRSSRLPRSGWQTSTLPTLKSGAISIRPAGMASIPG